MRQWGVWLRGAISVAACILLLWWVDWSAFQETIQEANGAWLMVAFLTIHADRWFMAYKWRDLLTASGTAVSVGNTIKAYYIGSFWSAFLPASVGGDLVRISWLRKRVRPLENLGVEALGVEDLGVESSEVENFDASEQTSGERDCGAAIASSVVIERFLGSLALAIAACVSLFLLTQQLNLTLPALSRSILFILLISIGAVGAVFNRTLHTLVVRLIARLKLKKLSTLFEKVGMATLLFKEKPVLLLTFLTLSVIEQAFPMLAIYAMVKTLSIDLSFTWVVVSVPIILAIVRLPISIGGFGLQEGAYAFVLGFAGVSLSQAVALGITGRVLELLATLPGAFWTLKMPQSVR